MMEILQDYGREFLIFEPEDQPNVFAAPEPEYRELRSGNLDPRELKSWRYLDFTLQFLRERYGLFPDQHLVIDCPVHQIHPLKGEQPRISASASSSLLRGLLNSDAAGPSGVNASTVRQRIIAGLDLYDLVALLDKKGREHARQVVSDFYEKLHGQKLGHFPRRTGHDRPRFSLPEIMRYAVPKAALEKLFAIPVKGRGAGERFVKLALGFDHRLAARALRWFQLSVGGLDPLEQLLRLDSEAH